VPSAIAEYFASPTVHAELGNTKICAAYGSRARALSGRTTEITAIAKHGARNSALGWRGIVVLRALGDARG
jgi:hypothetical protein